MPLKRCQNNGQSGWKWGDSGKCYTGPNAKKMAIKQGIAIEGPDKFKDKIKSLLLLKGVSHDEIAEAALLGGVIPNEVMPQHPALAHTIASTPKYRAICLGT